MPYVDEYGRVIDPDANDPIALAARNQAPDPNAGQRQAAQAQELFRLRQQYPGLYGPQAELKPYDPSLQERAAAVVAGDRPSGFRSQLANLTLGGTGTGPGGVGLVDFTPAAIPFAAHETGREIGGVLNRGGLPTFGDVGNVGFAALGAVPMVGAEARGARAAGRGFEDATRAARAATLDVASRDLARSTGQAVSDVPLQDFRISQRFPTGTTRTEDPLTQNLLINRAVVEREPEKLAQTENVVGSWKGLGPEARDMTPAERLTAQQQQMKDNLLWLHDITPKEVRDRAGGWYWGAHEIADQAARRTGVPVQSAAGTYAGLSPQMDWYKNVYLGDQTLDILHRDPKFTTEMRDRALDTGKDTMLKPYQDPAAKQMLREFEGKRLSDFQNDPLKQAMFLRLYDEAHGPRVYHEVTPEGGRGPLVRTQAGEPARPGWGSFSEVRNALAAAQSGGDLSIISPAMGAKHKVRNFYNNIVAPWTPREIGDVTIDTHQGAAALLRPLSGASPEVQQILQSGGQGAPRSAVTGLQGIYPIVADATRQAAAERGIPVPSMQSIPWETVRQLYDPKFKSNPSKVSGIDAIWDRVSRGEINVDQARAEILRTVGGYKAPSWAAGR